MSYRDQLAFRTRRDDLARNVAGLVARCEELRQRETALRDALRGARFRLALIKLGRWSKRHPITTLTVLAVVGMIAVHEVDSHRRAAAHRARVASVLGTGCGARLSVHTEPTGKVYVNGVGLGEAPIKRQLCPGRYLVQVMRDDTLFWQRIIAVKKQQRIELHAELIPNWNRPGDAMVIRSEPPNAIVFVNGKEAGIAPVLVRSSQLGLRRGRGHTTARIGLWRPGCQPVSRTARFARDAWFKLYCPASNRPLGGESIESPGAGRKHAGGMH